MNRIRNPRARSGGARVLLTAALVALAPASADAWPGCEIDWFELSAHGDTVTVDHDRVSYNCCMDHAEWVVDLIGSTLQIVEHEITPVPCTCMCCFELSVGVAGCPAGPLDVEFHWNDSDSGEWQIWTGTIVVQDVGQISAPSIAAVEASDCLPPGTGVAPPDPRPWAILKSWYRSR